MTKGENVRNKVIFIIAIIGLAAGLVSAFTDSNFAPMKFYRVKVAP